MHDNNNLIIICRAGKIVVLLGAHGLQQQQESSRVTFTSENHASHPNYKRQSRVPDFDISYVRLPSAVSYNGE
jgi:hypothetical protein